MTNIPATVERRVDRLRDDGIRLQLFDALFDAASVLLDQAGRTGARESAAVGQAVIDYLLTPRIQDRIHRLEDRLVVLVSDGSAESPGLRARIAEVASHRVASRMMAPRIGGDTGDPPAIGLARIGDAESTDVAAVIYDSILLRSSGAWQRLPVGTIVRPGVEPAVLGTIGDSSVAPECGASGPGGAGGRSTRGTSDGPVEAPVAEHVEA